ncbi:MAG: hypothetical protein B0A82_21360 [Alkalinema sp. CACIAM 70d]|nr:MAG: hypothetical protein B0A82_21360 [Alkalinema sp. CACIAM 70d]
MFIQLCYRFVGVGFILALLFSPTLSLANPSPARTFVQPCTNLDIAQAIANFKDPWQQQTNARYLVACGSAAVPALLQTLQTDPDATVREWAIISLGWIGDPVVIPVLIARLQSDVSAVVRRTAADALGQMQAVKAVPALVAMLKKSSEDIAVRNAVAEALGLISDNVAIQQLVAVLNNPREDLNLRNIAIKALIKIGDPAIPVLIQTLDHPDLRSRYWAALALAEINSAQSLTALKAQSNKVDQILEAAYDAEIVEFDRVPASAAQRGSSAQIVRKPIVCKIKWVAQHWARCR